MNIEQVKEVFACHPTAERVFVVDDMPFLDHGHAQNYAGTIKKEVKTYVRHDVVTVVNPDDTDTNDGPDGTGEPGGTGPDDTGEATGTDAAVGGDTANGKAKAKSAATK